MNKLEMHHTVMAAKARKEMTWDRLSDLVGKAPVWLASVCYGMNSATPDVAARICEVLELGEDVALTMTEFPVKGWDKIVPQDPLIYRLYEVVGVYGPTLKDVIQEKFGDGIMSAIDFSMHVEKIEDPKGDRVLLTLNGKFLPYRSW
ncbi:cyanase [Pseudomonas sp. SWRI74]|jgi:cyanate lyase|uniref:Cyanate hydratase n=2 Tax=Pseudomonas TaxID=286 RepID=A0A5E7A5M0_PSEFL|nr:MULTISPECIES: cyanase [Pseudomonas]MBV4522151.1 cyanase [Pseudomonas azerbaijanoccidentalis]MCK8667408.1 cyanase [Pseudomonas azerbaijanoccidentalis]VVN74096.1 Cyanate hydratase [Pseudomonas fluorescens]